MTRGYYQLGGFRPQIQWFRYDEKRLAQTIAGDKSPLRVEKGPVELILGIKRSGTSHLLLTESQTWDVAKSMRLPAPTAPPLGPTGFESLSPIEFWNAEELAKKLGTMKPKAHKGRTPVDNSQSNKQYNAGGEDGVHRAAFEHGRLLYQIMHGAVDLGKYSLKDDFWMQSIRVCAFAFNTLAIDERSSQERLAHPIILDCGITTVDVPDLDQTKGTAHFALYRNLKLQASRLAFKHGTTEELDDSAIASRLQAFLEPATDRYPTVLLVHGEEISRNVLRNMGVDISAWQSGLKRLLGFVTPQMKNEAGPSRPNDPRRKQPPYTQPEPKTESRSLHSSPSYRGDYEQRRHRSRSRSRSPSRAHNRSSNGSHPSASSSRYDYHPRRSPPRSRDPRDTSERGPEAFAPVYVVDVQQLYRKLMQTDDGSESVASIAQQLRLRDEQGYCAGNEAVMLIEIWRSMISGSPIDDQRAFRATLIPLKLESAEAKVFAKPPPAGDSDEERDPNDIVQNVTSSFVDEPDSDDYGSSDSGY